MISIVIGANFGDCGKGLITDYLSNDKSLVVRFNGGAQAGHTVVTPEGDRHVFHHFGSGSFRGSATFLSEYFVAHPMVFFNELEDLWKLGVTPKVIIDPRCMVTTPWDVMFNQALEKKRGSSRHGSCGMGFNETIERHSDSPLSVYHLADRYRLQQRLDAILDGWVNKRADALGIGLDDLPYLKDKRIIENFVNDCQRMTSFVELKFWKGLNWKGDYVFEGAQGLKLDMVNGVFPHVTRSRTGIENAVNLIIDKDIHEVPKVYYVTRTYLTRHGEGPLRNETGAESSWCNDETNKYNDHQGAFRYAYLDIDDLVNGITDDIQASHRYVSPYIALTCADQVENGIVRFVHNNKTQQLSVDLFSDLLMQKIGAEGKLISFGSDRSKIRSY